MTKKATCRACGELYDYRRRQLGYNFCLDCGDFAARQERMGWCIVPTPKGHYTRVTNKAELLDLNQKPRV